MTDILIPNSGDFEAWAKSSDVCLAVDWDGTCKDTMVPKWTEGFNRAVTEVWPELKPHQGEVDRVCYEVNITDPATAGVQRFVALKVMMDKWKAAGLPAPDLARFFAAVETVERKGEQHGVETYKRYQGEFGYDDSPLQWSETSDRIIAESVKTARMFDNCHETLKAVYRKCDLAVVSASKTEVVRQDLVDHNMAGLFKALLAQDFLPKKGILGGLAARYDRVLFVGDTQHDVRAAAPHGVPVYLIVVGDEDACWAAAGNVFQRFIAGDQCRDELIWP